MEEIFNIRDSNGLLINPVSAWIDTIDYRNKYVGTNTYLATYHQVRRRIFC